jgi:hypothetical protein
MLKEFLKRRDLDFMGESPFVRFENWGLIMGYIII